MVTGCGDIRCDLTYYCGSPSKSGAFSGDAISGYKTVNTVESPGVVVYKGKVDD